MKSSKNTVKSTAATRRSTLRDFRRTLLASAALAALAPVAWGQISYTTAGGSATQNFDSLPSSNVVTGYDTTGSSSQITYAAPSQADRNGMMLGAYTTLPGFYFGDNNTATSGTPAQKRTNFEVDTLGTGTTGATYSYGFAGANPSTDRALGALSSSSESPVFGVAFQNNTGSTLSQFTLSYRGEQYRQTANAHALSFSYLATSTFSTADLFTAGTSATGLNFTALKTGTAGALDGNLATNFATVTGTVTGFSLAPGAYLWLRWSKTSSTSPGLAVDDLNFSANVAPPARNLVWNPPSTTWNNTNTNWLDGASSTAFTNFDNANFTDAGVGSVVVNATGITANTTTVSNTTGTYTFSGGPINGLGSLTKTGAGTADFTVNNGYTGATIMNGGTVRTSAVTALGTGTMQVTGNATLETTSALSLSLGIAGTAGAVLIKTGAGTLTVAGDSGANSGASMVIANGKILVNSMAALGGSGSSTNPAMALTLNSGTELIANVGGSRIGAGISLNSATLTRPALTPDGDTLFESLTGFNNLGTMTVSGATTIQNLDIAAGTNAATSSAPSNSLAIHMPILVNSGAVLTLNAANNVGDYGSNAVSLRGVTNKINTPDDSVTLNAGASIVMTGVGEKRIGATTTGKPVVGHGTSASEALLKLDQHSFLTDIAANVNVDISRLVVAGTGTGGLRIEAPMNAVYNVPVDLTGQFHPTPTYGGTTGLFGINTTDTQEGITPPPGNFSFGNAYTVMSPKRYAQLSDSFGVNNPVTLGGTLTIAATDAAGATGVIDNGPAAAAPITLAVDNTATSGNLVYQILPSGNGGNFKNFAGLNVKRSNTSAGTVTASVPANGTNTHILRVGTLDVDGTAALDLNDNDLVVNNGNFATLQGLVLGGYRPSPDTTATGIVSTTSQNTGGTAIVALFDNALIGFADFPENSGNTIAANAIAGKYTYIGDTNYDGQVSAQDYTAIDANIGTSQPLGIAWFFGDTNFDGNIDATDYTGIDAALGLGQGNPLSAQGLAAVPEPASLSVLAIGAVGLLSRRRRKV